MHAKARRAGELLVLICTIYKYNVIVSLNLLECICRDTGFFLDVFLFFVFVFVFGFYLALFLVCRVVAAHCVYKCICTSKASKVRGPIFW